MPGPNDVAARGTMVTTTYVAPFAASSDESEIEEFSNLLLDGFRGSLESDDLLEGE